MINVVENGKTTGDKSSPVVKHSIGRRIVMHDVNKMFLKYITWYRFPEQINR